MTNGEEFIRNRVAGAYHKGLYYCRSGRIQKEMAYVDSYVSSKYSEKRIEQLKKRFGLIS